MNSKITSPLSSDSVRSGPIACWGFELVENLDSDTALEEYLEIDALHAALAHSGAVILRDFRIDLESFDRIVAACSARVTCDPARVTSTANTAEIKAGLLEMGLHRENGSVPFVPDLQWFYCAQAARVGSQTTLCDGMRVLRELSRDCRQSFERRRVRYSRRIAWANVQRFLGVELGISATEVDDSHLASVNSRVPGQTYTRIDPYFVRSEMLCSAMVTSKLSGKLAFCNSLLGPSVNYEPPEITWEDGEDISFDIWDEIKEVTARMTYDLFWKEGDVVVLDNARVMHGRRRLADPSRRIFGAQSYCKGVP